MPFEVVTPIDKGCTRLFPSPSELFDMFLLRIALRLLCLCLCSILHRGYRTQ